METELTFSDGEMNRVFQRIKKYQEMPVFHPLTCRIDSMHDWLYPEIRNDELVLVCPTCGYIQHQTSIPHLFFEDDFDKSYEQMLHAFDFQEIDLDKENKE